MALLTPSESTGEKKLGVGLFAPEIPFSGPAERYRLVQGIAQHLSNGLGVPFEGRAYKTAHDFARDVQRGTIHFAVLGGLYVATDRQSRILAIGQLARNDPWTIMAGKLKTIEELKGKVLQIPGLGPITVRFVENGLLAGSVDVKKTFLIKMAPDLRSAQTAVRLGRADAALAPVSSPGLTKVVDGLRIPPPAFVGLDKQLPQATVDKVTRLMLSYGVAIAGIQGWKRGDRVPYHRLVALSAKKTYRMMLAPVGIVHLEDQQLINIKALRPSLPTLEGKLFWVP